MNKSHTPDTIPKPFGNYSHAMEIPAGARLLFLAGQVGAAPDGSTLQGIEAQADACWKNLGVILASAGMGFEDLVKINTYLLHPEDTAASREARDRYIGKVPPASTLVIVRELAKPDWLIEIEAVAAKV